MPKPISDENYESIKQSMVDYLVDTLESFRDRMTDKTVEVVDSAGGVFDKASGGLAEDIRSYIEDSK